MALLPLAWAGDRLGAQSPPAATTSTTTSAPAEVQRPLLLRATTLGPAAWRSLLGPTNLGSMLAATDAEALWRSVTDRIDGGLAASRGDAAAFRLERERALAYAGAVDLLVWLEHAEDALMPARWSAALVVRSDGSTDLQTLGVDLHRRLSVWLAPAMLPTQLSAMRLQPLVADAECATLVFAEPDDAAAALGRARAVSPPELARRSVARAALEVQPALGLLRDRASEREVAALWTGSGTQRVEIEIGLDGPQIAIDLHVRYGSGDRGMVGALLPSGAAPVAPLHLLVPDGAAAACTGRIDAAAVWTLWERTIATVFERPPESVRRQLDMEPATEVFAHLEPGVLAFWHLGEVAPPGGALLDDCCLVARVRDDAAFTRGLDALLRRFGVVPIEPPGGGLSVPDWRGAQVQIEVGIGICCVAFGRDRRALIDAVFARRQEANASTVAALQRLDAAIGGRFEVATLVARHLVDVWTLLLLATGVDLPLPDGDAIAAAVRRWLPLLRQNRLSEVLATPLPEPDAFGMRLRW